MVTTQQWPTLDWSGPLKLYHNIILTENTRGFWLGEANDTKSNGDDEYTAPTEKAKGKIYKDSYNEYGIVVLELCPG